MLKITRGLCPSLLLACGALLAQNASSQVAAPHPIVHQEFTKKLADLQGKEALILTVEYPPGSIEAVHRHDAHAFVYMLEGEIVMALKGGKEVTLRPGDTFYEGPEDIHTVGRNASTTHPARFVVVLVKKIGVDPVLPVK